MPRYGPWACAAAAAALTLAACHPVPDPAKLTWTKPGATAQDFAAQEWDCRAEATAAAPQFAHTTFSGWGPWTQANTYSRPNTAAVRKLEAECLEAHGWQPAAGPS